MRPRRRCCVFCRCVRPRRHCCERCARGKLFRALADALCMPGEVKFFASGVLLRYVFLVLALIFLNNFWLAEFLDDAVPKALEVFLTAPRLLAMFSMPADSFMAELQLFLLVKFNFGVLAMNLPCVLLWAFLAELSSSVRRSWRR